MLKSVLVAVLAFVAVSSEAAWRNLSDDAHYAGPKLTEQDLTGKVVLVDCWGVHCPPCRALLPRMEQLWKSFKSKPFVLVGSHCQGRNPEKVKELVEANKLTYPIYERFGLADGEPSFRALPFMYVVNHRGRVVYSGSDERAATEALVTAIGEIGGPMSLCGGVSLKKFKGFQKKLRVGMSIKTELKKLEAAAAGKNAALSEEAKAILEAIESAKGEVKEEIDGLIKSNPEEAIRLIKLFAVTWPKDAADYKAQIPALQKAVAEAKKAAKAK